MNDLVFALNSSSLDSLFLRQIHGLVLASAQPLLWPVKGYATVLLPRKLVHCLFLVFEQVFANTIARGLPFTCLTFDVMLRRRVRFGWLIGTLG